MVHNLKRGLVVVGATLGVLMLLVTATPPRWYVRVLAGPWTDFGGSTLIVLGSDSLGEGMLGESSYWRSVYAVRVWREGGFRHLILSSDRSVTAPMRDFIVCQGVPADVVTIEGRSTSTRENAIFTAELARPMPAPFVLLTSDYHMWRAHRAFTKAGLVVAPRPFPDAFKRFGDWRSRWGVFLDLVEESAKIAYYWWRGWI